MISCVNGNTLNVLQSEMMGGRGMIKPCPGSAVLSQSRHSPVGLRSEERNWKFIMIWGLNGIRNLIKDWGMSGIPLWPQWSNHQSITERNQKTIYVKCVRNSSRNMQTKSEGWKSQRHCAGETGNSFSQDVDNNGKGLLEFSPSQMFLAPRGSNTPWQLSSRFSKMAN